VQNSCRLHCKNEVKELPLIEHGLLLGGHREDVEPEEDPAEEHGAPEGINFLVDDVGELHPVHHVDNLDPEGHLHGASVRVPDLVDAVDLGEGEGEEREEVEEDLG